MTFFTTWLRTIYKRISYKTCLRLHLSSVLSTVVHLRLTLSSIWWTTTVWFTKALTVNRSCLKTRGDYCLVLLFIFSSTLQILIQQFFKWKNLWSHRWAPGSFKTPESCSKANLSSLQPAVRLTHGFLSTPLWFSFQKRIAKWSFEDSSFLPGIINLTIILFFYKN